jgi:hypothetical protein
LTPIKTERDYYRKALKEIENLWNAKPNTSMGDRLDVLVILVEAYESPITHQGITSYVLGDVSLQDLAPGFALWLSWLCRMFCGLAFPRRQAIRRKCSKPRLCVSFCFPMTIFQIVKRFLIYLIPPSASTRIVAYVRRKKLWRNQGRKHLISIQQNAYTHPCPLLRM